MVGAVRGDRVSKVASQFSTILKCALAHCPFGRSVKSQGAAKMFLNQEEVRVGGREKERKKVKKKEKLCMKEVVDC